MFPSHVSYKNFTLAIRQVVSEPSVNTMPKRIRMYPSLFQLNMVIMCIIVLCIIATLLYVAVNLLEKRYLKKH